MRFGFATVRVNDLEESERFYAEIIGLEKELGFSYREGLSITFMKDPGGSLVELLKMEGTAEAADSNNKVSLGFLVEDLDRKIKELKALDIEIRGPVYVPGGIRFIYIKDPNGVDIELVENFHIDRLKQCS